MKSRSRALFVPVAALVALLLTAKLTANLIALFLPPLPPPACEASPPPRPQPLPFAKAFGLQEPTAPSSAVATVSGTPLEASYRLSLTAVGDPSMAIILYRNKSHLLEVGDDLNGYRLAEVFTDRVRLQKGQKSYWLLMKEPKTARQTPSAEAAEITETIRHEGDTYEIPRELLERYTDPKRIFRYISIAPLRKKGHFEGFVITDVKRGSVFDKMGLRKRDIIRKINGRPVTNEAEAFRYFNRIREMNSLHLTVLRKGKEKELHYEIF